MRKGSLLCDVVYFSEDLRDETIGRVRLVEKVKAIEEVVSLVSIFNVVGGCNSGCGKSG